VGPEVLGEARRVLDAAGAALGFEIEWSEHRVGGAANATETPLISAPWSLLTATR